MSNRYATATERGPAPARILGKEWDQHSTFKIDEVAKILRISTWAAYEAVRRGEIPVTKVGRILRVGRPWVESQVGAGTEAEAVNA
jgi:excisionase family DNA binding protein